MTYLFVIYFFVIFSLLFIFFPSFKDNLLDTIKFLWHHYFREAQIALYKITRFGRMSKVLLDAKPVKNQLSQVFPPYMLLGVIAIVLLTVPPLLVLSFTSKNILDDYDDTQMYESNDQILALLDGERLVPPPALPPEVFLTQEVLLIRPAIVDASRDWVLLDDDFSQRLLVVIKVMKERHGYDMAILEGYRSPDRQNALAKMGGSVTNAKAYQSYHQFGLAADCAFKRDGKLVITEKDPWAMRGYQLYGEVAKSVGLNWGGDWKMMDFGHIEFRKPNTIKRN